jgi:hypothetical protein
MIARRIFKSIGQARIAAKNGRSKGWTEIGPTSLAQTDLADHVKETPMPAPPTAVQPLLNM